MISMVRFLPLIILMLVLGGCPSFTMQTTGSNDDFKFLTTDHDTHVVVRGNPFPSGQGRFADRVVAAMQGRD